MGSPVPSVVELAKCICSTNQHRYLAVAFSAVCAIGLGRARLGQKANRLVLCPKHLPEELAPHLHSTLTSFCNGLSNHSLAGPMAVLVMPLTAADRLDPQQILVSFCFGLIRVRTAQASAQRVPARFTWKTSRVQTTQHPSVRLDLVYYKMASI